MSWPGLPNHRVFRKTRPRPICQSVHRCRQVFTHPRAFSSHCKSFAHKLRPPRTTLYFRLPSYRRALGNYSSPQKPGARDSGSASQLTPDHAQCRQGSVPPNRPAAGRSRKPHSLHSYAIVLRGRHDIVKIARTTAPRQLLDDAPRHCFCVVRTTHVKGLALTPERELFGAVLRPDSSKHPAGQSKIWVRGKTEVRRILSCFLDQFARTFARDGFHWESTAIVSDNVRTCQENSHPGRYHPMGETSVSMNEERKATNASIVRVRKPRRQFRSVTRPVALGKTGSQCRSLTNSIQPFRSAGGWSRMGSS